MLSLAESDHHFALAGPNGDLRDSQTAILFQLREDVPYFQACTYIRIIR